MGRMKSHTSRTPRLASTHHDLTAVSYEAAVGHCGVLVRVLVGVSCALSAAYDRRQVRSTGAGGPHF